MSLVFSRRIVNHQSRKASQGSFPPQCGHRQEVFGGGSGTMLAVAPNGGGNLQALLSL
jgi:hypothetical protein